jgi:TRAP-type C4-dicarboxylate transport system substrate-binding protein
MKLNARPLLLMLMLFRLVRNVIVLSYSSLLVFGFNIVSTPVAADYKREFKMSIVPNQENPWGRAAERFADALRYRTQGRIQIKNYFNG